MACAARNAASMRENVYDLFLDYHITTTSTTATTTTTTTTTVTTTTTTTTSTATTTITYVPHVSVHRSMLFRANSEVTIIECPQL